MDMKSSQCYISPCQMLTLLVQYTYYSYYDTYLDNTILCILLFKHYHDIELLNLTT